MEKLQTSPPLVSVIMPAYNCGRYIKESIQSLLDQSYHNWELIVTDDCSTDDTATIIQSFRDSRIKYLHNDKNSGAAISRNNSIEHATGRYIAFLDSDDIWLPEKLTKQVAFMEDRKCAVSYTSYYTCDGESDRTGIVRCHNKETFRSLLCDDKMGTLTLMYDASILGKVYLPEMRNREDYGLKIRLLKQCGWAGGIHEPLAVYRVLDSSLSHGSKIKLVQYNIAVYHEVLGWCKIKANLFFAFVFMPSHLFKKQKIIIDNMLYNSPLMGGGLSVLISVYYKEKPEYLRQSLDSIFSQTLRAEQVVIVEDGPLTKELYRVLEEYVAKYPEVDRVPLSQNVGLGKALNEGLKHCRYELVARMDTDDISHPDRFEKQVAFMQEHPEVDLLSAWIDEFVEPGETISMRKLPETHEELYQYGRRRSPVNHPVVMFRKSAVETVGSYQDFPLFEDYYLWVRMLVSGARFHCLQDSLLSMRTNPSMFTRRGGWKYACTELKLQREFLRMGYTNVWQFTILSLPKFVVRLLPNGLRTAVYRKILR